MKTDPPITGNTHQLPLDKLSPDAFERLCYWLVEREGFESVEYVGEAGGDQGRDVTAWKGDQRFAFQCKRVRHFRPAEAESEIAKILLVDLSERPDQIVFLITCPVSVRTRRRAREAWGDERACHFWTGGELDERIKRYPEILDEFFHLPRSSVTTQEEKEEPNEADGTIPEAECDDKLIRQLSHDLEEAFLREEELISKGENTTTIREDILTLRRRIREGGKVVPGDFLLHGRFKLLKEIGDGGFGSVYKAFDRENRRICAIKMLHGQYAEDQSRRERFFRGARKMQEIKHQGIVKILEEKFEEEGFYFFVMEYMSGGDLRQAVLDSRFTQEELIRMIVIVAEALHFAHDQGIVHRDIKPANILLDGSGQPRVTDFDLVRAQDTTGGTRTGMLGTVVYAAPESMSHPAEAGVQADIYGLGMTTVFSLYGADLPLEALRNAPEFISRLETTERIRAACMRAVLWDMRERWASVKDFSQALVGSDEKHLPPFATMDSGRDQDSVEEDNERRRSSVARYRPRDLVSAKAFLQALDERDDRYVPRLARADYEKSHRRDDENDKHPRAFEPRQPFRHRRSSLRLKWWNRRPWASLLRLAILMAAAFAFLAWLMSSEAFALKTVDIVIDGNGNVTRRWIFQSLRSYHDNNIFRIDLRTLAATLSTHPWIRSVDIYRKLPSQLNVRVSEKNGIALLQLSRGIYYLDAQARVIAPLDGDAQGVELPIISMTQMSHELVESSVEMVKEIGRTKPTWFAGSFEIVALSKIDFLLRVEDVPPLIISRETLKTNFPFLEALLPVIRRSSEPREIDLRFPGEIILRPL